MEAKYLSCAETAKLICAALKRAFPGQEFSVCSRTYSGGASIDVDWTDGPAEVMVSVLVKPFAGSSFDPSCGLRSSHYSWLRADGTATGAEKKATPGDRLVQFGSDQVFTRRAMSRSFAERVIARVSREHGVSDMTVCQNHDGSARIDCGTYQTERVVADEARRLMIVRAA